MRLCYNCSCHCIKIGNKINRPNAFPTLDIALGVLFAPRCETASLHRRFKCSIRRSAVILHPFPHVTTYNMQDNRYFKNMRIQYKLLNPCLQRKNRKKLGALSTNCCIKRLVDLATQSGWDHEDARKTPVCGRLYVSLTCYRTVEKCSSLESVLIPKLSGQANDTSALKSSGTKRRATPTEHADAVKVVSLSHLYFAAVHR